jgi:CDP-paratose synthetase
MKVLMTGATGSIGNELVKALYNKSYTIALIVRDAGKASSAFLNFADNNISIISLLDGDWATQVANFSPEIVIHLAALLTSKDDQEIIPNLIASNITFGTQLLQALKATRVRLFINTGTFAEYFYGDGQHNSSYLYSATKTAFHSILKYYQQLTNFSVANVIPYTVYGQPDTQPKIMDIIYNSFFDNTPANMSAGQQTLDFIHITDVVDFYCRLIEWEQSFEKKWEDYHLGTGRGTTLREVAHLLSTQLGLPENINWGALPYRTRDTMYSVAPIAKLLSHFNWKPTMTIESGISKFLNEK